MSKITGSINPKTGKLLPIFPQQQPYRYGRRGSGRFTTIPYESISQSEIDEMALSADLAGLDYEVTLTHSKARIEIDYNWNNVVGGYAGQTTEAEETWEIVPQKATKDLLDSRSPLVLLCSNGALSDIKNLKANNLIQSAASKNLVTGLLKRQTWPNGVNPGTNYTDDEMKLFQLVYDGVEQIEIAAPILTHTKTVTAKYAERTDFSNVGKIISNDTLKSSENVPSTVLFDFPSDTNPDPIPIGGIDGLSLSFVYGWLKNSPSVRQVEKKKWNIVQTWNYGLWAIDLYGGTIL